MSGERLHYITTVTIRHKKNVVSVPVVKLKCLDVNINRHQDMIQRVEKIIEIVGVWQNKDNEQANVSSQ